MELRERLEVIDYNGLVKSRISFLDVVQLIRFAAILWIGYLVLLAVINQSFPGPQRMNPLYYVALGCIALLCLILSFWRQVRQHLRLLLVTLAYNV